MPVIFEDAFTGTSGTALAAHAPNTGTSWTLVFNIGTSAEQALFIIATDGTSVRATGTTGNAGSLYTADATGYGLDYEVEGNFSLISPGVGTTRTLNLFARVIDANNFIVACIIDSLDTNDIRIYKCVAGTATKISSTEDTAPTNGDVFTLVIVKSGADTLVSLKKGAATVINPITVSDAALQAAGVAGIGGGDFTGLTTLSSTSGTNLTNFKVTTPTPVVETPIIDPDGGTFEEATEVTLTCGTVGATIYYTTDGSTPDATDTEYTAPFTLTETTTVKAIGIKAASTDSAVASADFTIDIPVPASGGRGRRRRR